MRTPLIERLPPDDPEVERFCAQISQVDPRSSVGYDYARESAKVHARALRRYQEWCRPVGEPARHQPGVEFITSESLIEFAEHMIAERKYAPATIRCYVRAVQIFADRAGNVVSTDHARGLNRRWESHLNKRSDVKSKAREPW